MKMQSKTFKKKCNAKKYAATLKENGQLDIQIWELPSSSNKKVYVVIWYEK